MSVRRHRGQRTFGALPPAVFRNRRYAPNPYLGHIAEFNIFGTADRLLSALQRSFSSASQNVCPCLDSVIANQTWPSGGYVEQPFAPEAAVAHSMTSSARARMVNRMQLAVPNADARQHEA